MPRERSKKWQKGKKKNVLGMHPDVDWAEVQSSLGTHRGGVPRAPWMPKSEEAQSLIESAAVQLVLRGRYLHMCGSTSADREG